MKASASSEIRLIAGWVAVTMGGSLRSGDPDREFTGVSIDTRTLAAGDLFVAIRGERFDGADFVPAAIEAGAGGVVVPSGWGRPVRGPGPFGPGLAVIEVDDTIVALQSLAHALRRESGATVVAITGSAGKTTTKEVTAEFLADRYRVFRNRGNLNNHIGLPLSLIELRHRPDVAVVELGMNHAGEISTLVRIADPDVRVWTNVGDAHLEFFGSVEAIADAKAEVLEGARSATVLVANADDDRVVARIPRFSGRVVTFGVEREADVRATEVVDRGIDGMAARVTTRRGSFELATPLIGWGNLANILAATAVATELGVTTRAIAERAARLRPASHRGEILRLATGVVLIDDSYNANPAAMSQALEVLRKSGMGRHVAVLGEMLELGSRSIALHEEIGRGAARAGVSALITVGGAPAKAMAEAAVVAGLAKDTVRHFETSAEAADAAPGLIKAGDLVLVKGSRGTRTDRIVERLRVCASNENR